MIYKYEGLVISTKYTDLPEGGIVVSVGHDPGSHRCTHKLQLAIPHKRTIIDLPYLHIHGQIDIKEGQRVLIIKKKY